MSPSHDILYIIETHFDARVFHVFLWDKRDSKTWTVGNNDDNKNGICDIGTELPERNPAVFIVGSPLLSITVSTNQNLAACMHFVRQ